MRTSSLLLPALLFLGACGSMQETVQVRDDVYDIPDRTAVASIGGGEADAPPASSDDYYNEQDASEYQQGSYYDATYNDPAWYNRDRFGFGYSMSPYGSSWGMSYSTGNYDPYWNNSWQSGYGAWGNPYGYYSPWNGGIYDPWGYNSGWGSGYGCGYNWGMSTGYGGYYGAPYGGYYGYPYGGYYGAPYGGCCGGYGYGYGYGGYYPVDAYGNPMLIGHRPSLSDGGVSTTGTGGGGTRAARPGRGISLLAPPQHNGTSRPGTNDPRYTVQGRGATDQWRQPTRTQTKVNTPRPGRSTERSKGDSGSPRIDLGGGSGGGGSFGGRGGGGGSSPSPSPRPR